MTEEEFMREAIRMARSGMRKGAGGPFGAVVVKGNTIVGQGFNQVLKRSDPTAHAEILAIRDACWRLGTHQLTDCTIYSSCEPCPMCLGAIYWARPKRLVFACSREDAAAIAFDDKFIYRELQLPLEQRRITTDQLLREEALPVLQEWASKPDKTAY